MELSGTRLIPASQDHTWHKLMAADTLKVCINGCERIEQISDHAFLVKLRAEVGPISARFEGQLEMTDIEPPHAYGLRFSGTGGAAGAASGYAAIALAPEGDATRLSYTAHVDLQGKLSQLRPEQAEKIARKMMDNFFALFSVCACRALDRPPPRAARVQPEATRAYAPAFALAHPWFNRLSWLVPPLVIAVLIVYHFYMRG